MGTTWFWWYMLIAQAYGLCFVIHYTLIKSSFYHVGRRTRSREFSTSKLTPSTAPASSRATSTMSPWMILPSCALQRWGVSKKAPQSANLQICGLIFFRFADRPQMGNFRICDLRTINFLRFAIRGPIFC